MSHGGGESGRECVQQNGSNKRVKYGLDEFGRAVAKIAMAQICESEGYQGFQQSALETLSNVAVRYIHNLGKSAKFHANLAGRTGCNIFDIVQGLDDFGAVQGFPGASDIDRCPLSSGTVKELIQYASESVEIPFACDVPQFPIVKDRKLAPSFSQVDEEPPGCHIPSWLPAFPDPLTFILPSTKVGLDDGLDQMNKVAHPWKHKEMHPLLSLHRHMSHSRLERPSSDTLDSSMVAKAAEINPFLASPRKYGEVEESPVVIPIKPVHDTSLENNIMENHVKEENHFPKIEDPAHTANPLENHLDASGDEKETTQANQRVAVKFSIRVSRKYIITSMDGGDDEKCVDDSTSWLGKVESDDKTEDKKWIGDHNLNGGMENLEELAQL